MNLPDRIVAIGGAGKAIAYELLEADWVRESILQPRHDPRSLRVTIVVRSRRIDAEIDTIRTAVGTLMGTWELTPGEARARVTDSVPELAPPQQSGGLLGGSGLSDNSNVREAAGLFGMVAVFVVVLVAAGAVGFGPLSGVVQVAGSDSSPSVSMAITGGEFRANETVTVVVQVDGSQVSGENITVTATADGYTRNITEQMNETGVVWFELQLPQNATTTQFEASFGSSNDSQSITVRPADPAKLVLNRSNVTVGPNETVSVTANVTDEFGNVVGQTPVTVTARSNATIVKVDGGPEAAKKTRNGAVTFTIDPVVANTTTVVSVTAPAIRGDTLKINIRQSNTSAVNGTLSVRGTDRKRNLTPESRGDENHRAGRNPEATSPAAGVRW